MPQISPNLVPPPALLPQMPVFPPPLRPNLFVPLQTPANMPQISPNLVPPPTLLPQMPVFPPPLRPNLFVPLQTPANMPQISPNLVPPPTLLPQMPVSLPNQQLIPQSFCINQLVQQKNLETC
jgi:hypothetical protein